MFKKCWRVAAIVLLLSPSAAHADWLFSPAVGYPFAGDTLGRQPTYAFALGWLDDESFGVEADLAYAPSFFDGGTDDFTGSGSVLTAMGNFLVTGPAGRRALPYVTVGAGYMRMQVTSDGGQLTTSTREAGFNAGAGLMAFMAETVGLRADLRYFRSFRDLPPSWTSGVAVDIAPGAFDFWRASVGVTIRIPE